MKKLTPAPALP